MEPSALYCQILDGLPPQRHQSINNRITLLKKKNARKKVFYQFITRHCTGDLKLIANMMTDLSPRGSPTCHLREDLVKAEKHFILFNVHRSLSLSFSVCDIISICANFHQSYSAHIVTVAMQIITIILSNIVNIFNHLELCPYADSVARPAIRTERSPPRRPC